VWIAGSYQSDFARNYAREGLEISDMVAEALRGTLRSAGLEPEDVESIHVGNAFGQLFTGQGQLGAMPATVEPRLWGKPAARHEADEYDRRYGLNDAHLHAIAELNMRTATDNPLAQTRGWTFGPGGFAGDDRDNPVVEGRLRRTDCAQVTDGVAGVLLVSDRYRAERLGGQPLARIAGWGHGTAALPLPPELDRSQGQPYVFPHVRQVVTDAFRRAEIPGVGALDGAIPVKCQVANARTVARLNIGGSLTTAVSFVVTRED
jgi:acetyl-CoA acetyltransferase